MTPIDREHGPEDDAQRFERLLLDSARADALPRDVSGAWASFSATLLSVGELTTASASAGAARLRPPSADTDASALGGGTRALALKWLVVGALAGSALTAFTLDGARAWRTRDSATVASVSPVTSVAPPVQPASVAPAAVVPQVVGDSSSGRATLEAERVRPRHVPKATAASVPTALPSANRGNSVENPLERPHSTLGAQVALLDAARTAAAAGAFGEALSLIERYRHDFPTGELAPDAEVVAIEALAAQSDDDALRERVARFLARYPADPHVARVKALAGR
jgi:hypothetical protein